MELNRRKRLWGMNGELKAGRMFGLHPSRANMRSHSDCIDFVYWI